VLAEGLIERESERLWLKGALKEAVTGRGSLVLLAGDAGVGKTSFAEDVLRDADAQLLRGAAGPAAIAYGPIVAALRDFTRAVPGGLATCGPLQPHLALLLPELGEAVADSDRATLFEAVRCGLVAASAQRPAIILLDDLQWSDETTLELLGALATPLREMPVLIVGAYRSDEMPRAHPLRRLRNELRRNNLLSELTLEPLTEAGTAELAGRELGGKASPALMRALHDRTGGIPFFVEELAAGLEAGGLLQEGSDGLELALDADVPVPQTIRDAVLLRAGDLSRPARQTAEAAAVAGTRFEPELIAALGLESGLDELIESDLVAERPAGGAAFRHPLARDAIYEDIPWVRRRSLHRDMATAMEKRGDRQAEIAAHWLAAHDGPRALDSLLLAVAELAAVHAYRDAATVGRQALELWPEGERGGARIELLQRHAHMAELAGELTEAARAQREVIAARRSEGAGRALADAERAMAAICELQGDRERALAARRVAADAYAANGLPGEAAIERLIAAGYLQSRADLTGAIALAEQAIEEAGRAERVDLRARALGLKGVATVKAGGFEEGVETIRGALALALENELTLVAAEVYQRLGTALEIAGDYGGARDALTTAVGFCDAGAGDGMEYTCRGCMAYVLRELGDWDSAAELSRELRFPGASPDATLVADGILGSILAFRGNTDESRTLLEQCLATGIRLDVLSMSLDSAAALAWLEEQQGDLEQARAHCRFVLERWRSSEDHHYAVWGLRWAACFFARHGELEDSRACAGALSSIAADTGHTDVLAALAHALGEAALAEGEFDDAVEQMTRAAEMHESLEIPYERAQIQLRAGVALAAAGEKEAAIERLSDAHARARRLGASVLVSEAAERIAEMGESVEARLGRRAAAEHETGGLSRREVEVVRLVASGHTNREIASQLVLSTRTIDMHVRNILAKLGCKTRTEAAAKAGDLGVLV
jgi:DNA-binding NarL/FixJ family response regulator